MSWKSIIIKTDNASADRLSESLLEHGALSADIHDAEAGTDAEQPLYGEPGLPAEQVWQKAEVTGLFDNDADLDAIMQSVKAATQLSQMPSYRTETVEAQDWVRLTQSQFSPIQISARLWVVPTWHRPPDPAAINLILDPGLAFGTGSHPTTQLCLVWLDQHLKQGETLLDYGCGSGILAIAALKLGAGHVTGIDIDPHAVKASQANALLNDCDQSKLFFSTHYQTNDPDDKTGETRQVDIVIANILSNPLIMLAPILEQATRKGGQIVLSGILQAQADEVKVTYQKWFDMQSSYEQDGWILLTGIKK